MLQLPQAACNGAELLRAVVGCGRRALPTHHRALHRYPQGPLWRGGRARRLCQLALPVAARAGAAGRFASAFGGGGAHRRPEVGGAQWIPAREAPHPRGRAALAVHLAGAAGAVRARARRAAPRVPAAGRLYARSLPLPGAGVASGRHTRRRQGADLAADAPPGQIPRLCAATVQGRHREQGFGPGRVQLSGGGGHLFRRPAYCGRRLAQSPGTDLQLRRRVRARVWSEGPRRRTVRHAGRRDHRHGWGGAGLARRRAHCGD
mmetsp:Transcript_8209/g.27106  ORF Transcript_8209/g.27106 Transcript_8209/m.27106 type:complete len:262 (+) Transcript_8209:536-1321(+)